MAFRADESARSGLEETKSYLTPRDSTEQKRKEIEDFIYDVADKYGAAVNSYPSWHPLVSNYSDDRSPTTVPGEKCGYESIDHTRYFLNAFITCPYHFSNADKVIESVEKLPYSSTATITAERIDIELYAPGTCPVLVCCDWHKDVLPYSTIPASVAIPLMLQKEVPCWEFAERAETWESMRYDFLGSPHGKRSSLFVDQQTALTMKKVWQLLINTGMYGPIKVSNQMWT